ncbi:hypothetical protein WMO79_00660 [Micrococcaceae bacterium Sec7.4]
MGKRLQMAPTGEYILWAVIPETDKSTFNRAYGPFASRSVAYSAKTALIKNKRASMRNEGYKPEEIEAEIEAIEWTTTGLWNKVETGRELIIEPASGIDPNSPAEAAAAALWNNQGPVTRGVRPRWDEARNDPEWAKSVQGYRIEAQLALDAAAQAQLALDSGTPGGRPADDELETPAEQVS